MSDKKNIFSHMAALTLAFDYILELKKLRKVIEFS